MGLAAAAADFQSLALHGGKMGAARDESDIGTRFGQRRAEPASDAAGADNRNTHGISSDRLQPTEWVGMSQACPIGVIANEAGNERGRQLAASKRQGFSHHHQSAWVRRQSA
jgi:hypothetical protein